MLSRLLLLLSQDRDNEGKKLMSKVLDQNGISRVYNMLEIYQSGPEPLMCSIDLCDMIYFIVMC